MNDFKSKHSDTADYLWSLYKTENNEKVLHLFLKNYFKKNKKFGGRDRKDIKNMLYARVRAELMGSTISPLRAWDQENTQSPKSLASKGIATKDSFFKKLSECTFSEGISGMEVVQRYFQPSKVFCFVLKKDSITKVKSALPEVIVDGHMVAVPMTTSLTQMWDESEYFIQDWSCQKMWDGLTLQGNSVWEPCAGAGGKSLILAIFYKNMMRYASDKRSQILANLNQRFSVLKLSSPYTFTLDLTKDNVMKLSFDQVENILCDVPCSGSGTWHRTPEAAWNWKMEELQNLVQLQKDIVTSAVKKLNSGGQFIYTTCSVFRDENENVVAWMQEKLGMELVHQQLINGYPAGGDILFRAVLKKN